MKRYKSCNIYFHFYYNYFINGKLIYPAGYHCLDFYHFKKLVSRITNKSFVLKMNLNDLMSFVDDDLTCFEMFDVSELSYQGHLFS